MLYGTSLGGGSSGWGVVFTINTNGTGYSDIKSFPAATANASGIPTNYDGAGPMAGLVSDGSLLYGTTYQGGSGGRGTVFALKMDGTDFTVLNNFNGTNGKTPYAGLTLSSNILYGTTTGGGISNKGTIFQVNTDGTGFGLLKSFTTTDGILLLSSVALSGDTLFGTTYDGGISNRGTIFSINTNGTGFSVLKTFNNGDGTQPHSTLLVYGNALFGTTDGNGVLSNSIIFRINTDGTGYAVLKRFSDIDPVSGTNADGSYVRAGLALWNGVLYGTTEWGGVFGNGVVFKMNLDGSGFAVLKHFSATTYSNGNYINIDGAMPLADLMVADGVLYGTTRYGGTYGAGTLFSFTIPPTPALQTTNLGGHPLVYWADDGLNRALQTAPDLVSGNWTNVLTLNWTNASMNPQKIGYQITDLMNHPAAFFLLR